MRVTIQVQETRKPYDWKSVFPARVLFASRELIVVKGCGSHSFFYGTGQMRMAGYRPAHPHAKNVPDRHGSWRIHPDSVKRIKLNTQSKSRPSTIRGTSQGSGSKGSRSPSVRSPSASKAAHLRSSRRRAS